MSHIYIYTWVSLHDAPLHSDTHVNESFHIYRNHVTCEGVMSHVNVSCDICMDHVTYEWIMSHMNESCHADVTTWYSECLCMMLRESRMNYSCRTWISYVSHIYAWVSLHDAPSVSAWYSVSVSAHVTHELVTHVTHELVMSHTYMPACLCMMLRYIPTNMNASFHI